MANHPHPYFDDKGTLDWYTRLEDAKAAAKAQGKRIFIEFGREQCSQCRTLVQNTVPREDVAARMAPHFVALAAEADDTEPAVLDLAMKLEDAMMLPFVIFTDADGNFLSGFSGVFTPPPILKSLDALGVPS